MCCGERTQCTNLPLADRSTNISLGWQPGVAAAFGVASRSTEQMRVEPW